MARQIDSAVSELAVELCDLAGIGPGMSVLNPLAGEGHIAEICRERGAIVHVCEVQDFAAQVLIDTGFFLIGRDFAQVKTEVRYDRVIMDLPPLPSEREARYLNHARDLLAPEGIVVAAIFTAAGARQVVTIREQD